MGELARRSLRSVVVGGGPAGLLYATLVKRRHPHHDVVVYERNARDATFGFGVVFSERTLGGLAAVDRELHDAVVAAGVHWQDIEVRRHGERIRCGGHGFSAIARKTLLATLQEHARAAGVDLCFEREAREEDRQSADVVVAADGVNSLLRQRHAAALRPRVETGRAKYIWFATPQPFDALTFVFERTEHGEWGAHAYPFEASTSTFIVETDEATWRRAGLDRAGDLGPGRSDLRSMRHLEAVFADHLGGHGLLENNSKWLEFRTLRCARWSTGNLVALGDAVHTAHFSVGSGTKMAMEDAVALAEAIEHCDALPEAFARYEQDRRASVERIQAASAPSLAWWERFGRLPAQSTEQFAFHFLTRSPQVTGARLTARDARFVRRVERRVGAALGAEPADDVLAAPLQIGDLRLSSRLVAGPVGPGPDAGAVALALALGGAGAVLVAGADVDPELPAGRPAGRVLTADAGADAVAEAARAGFRLLQMPLDADGADRWPADRPLLTVVRPPAEVEGEAGDELLARLCRRAERHLVVAVVVADRTAPDPLSGQLLLCDRIKQETPLPVCLADTVADADHATTALLAGRADLAQGIPSLVSRRWAAPPAVPSVVP